VFHLQNLSLPEGRVVFEVTLEGSARKLVTVRSSLVLINELPETVELKLENTSIHSGGNKLYHFEVWVPHGSTQPFKETGFYMCNKITNSKEQSQ
jgi:hypothetical protein